jgi:transposase InsO family protein
VLVELNVVELRFQAVLEVLNDGASVTDVARRHGVSRQSVHAWLKRYANEGLAALADGSARPLSCPHQMPPEVEARIVELRREHPGWGPRTIGHQLVRDGVEPVPGRSSIYRCLVRHRLITPEARQRKRSDYIRWERSKAMELWQMDIVGGVKIRDAPEAKIVSGIDDHSRFVISACVVPRATARPTCDALALAMRRFGCPSQILTDNGKVFTGRFGPGTGEVLFDRICRENGIKHILTAPRSPTTTGKVERWHKTLRREFLDGKLFDSVAHAQAELDAWVEHYNHDRPHQSLGMVAPWERFRLAKTEPGAVADSVVEVDPAGAMPALTATRKVSQNGTISFAAASYRVRRRPGARPPSRRGRGDPRSQAPARQGTRQPAPRSERLETTPPSATPRVDAAGDTQGRLGRFSELRRRLISGRQPLRPPPGSSDRDRRPRRDLDRR